MGIAGEVVWVLLASVVDRDVEDEDDGEEESSVVDAAS